MVHAQGINAKPKKNSRVKDYRHDEKQKNNPSIGMVSYEPKVAEPKKNRYAYDPHLSPRLVWAGKPGLKSIEVEEASELQMECVSLRVQYTGNSILGHMRGLAEGYAALSYPLQIAVWK